MDILGFGTFELAGLSGVVLYLGSYGALQSGLIRGSNPLYAIANGLAAALVLVSLMRDFNLSSAIIQLAWILISVMGLLRIYYIHHVIRFSEDEKRMFDNKLRHLPKDQAKLLFKSGDWITVKPGTTLATENRAIENFHYILSGSASVMKSGIKVANCDANEFIGEITCFSGDPATGSVVTTSQTRLFRIEIGRLRKIAPVGSVLRNAIEQSIADDLRAKIGANKSQYIRDDESAGISQSLLKDIEIVSAG